MTFASVLGGNIITIEDATFDADMYKNHGRYFVKSLTLLHVPQNSWAFFFVEKSKTGPLIQYWLPDSSDTIYYRRGHSASSWNEWVPFSFNMPQFYKNYNSLEELKAALAAI